jgi:hypothetical protein
LLADDLAEPSELSLLEGVPIFITYRLTWEIEKWVADMSAKYMNREEEIVESILQVGQYITTAYPRCLIAPAAPLVLGVLPADYMSSRAQQCATRAGKVICDMASVSSRTESALRAKNRTIPEVTVERGKGERGESVHHDLITDGKAEAGDLTKVPSERQHALASELVSWLFRAGSARSQNPRDLLREATYAAYYLDHNFPDNNLTSFREQLLGKVLAADQFGRLINKLLMTMENQVVDVTTTLEKLRRSFDASLAT